MEKMLIKKSTDIQASKEKIWDVLTTDEYTREWFSEFSEGTFVITDWQVGSKALFIDESKSGLIATVASNKPGQELILEYQGMVADGQEDFESEQARGVIGYRECYWLRPSENGYTLDIESDMGSEYFDFMSQAWDRSLVKIKALAENDEHS
jgi:hypothetical protein